jgi:hypothetical protein
LVSHIKGRTRTKGFKKRVLRGVFGPKSDEILRDWRKLQNVELQNMHSPSNIIRMTKL